MKRIINYLRKQKSEPVVERSGIPTVNFSTLVPSAEFSIHIVEPTASDGNVSLFELFVINSVVRTRKPKTLFEIGTFNGRTTLNLAANSEDPAGIITLDLPAEQLDGTQYSLDVDEIKYVRKPASGACFSDRSESSKITQVYGDSAKFDFSRHENAIDFVFVDASHAYEYVMSDSKVALRLLRNGKGTILWHDYGRDHWWQGVTDALDKLYQDGILPDLVHIEGTSLVSLVRD